MRRSFSIVKVTALEILSEPLTLLVLLAALVLAVLAPAFHYHQFGDPTRMARDAGFSALFTCGGVVAVFGTIRSFRREIESGTLEMALVHPISRAQFFLSKTAGALVAVLLFAWTVLCTTAIVFEGAAIGGQIAQRTGDIARLYGPCLAVGVGILVVPLVVAAVLNRFARFRFVLSAMTLAWGLSAVGAGLLAVLTRGDVLRLVPVAIPVVLLVCVFLSAAAAFAVRFKGHVAASAVGVLLLACLPAIGNYYLVAALSGPGGALSWGYVAWAFVVTVPALAAFLLLGVHFIDGRDIQWTA